MPHAVVLPDVGERPWCALALEILRARTDHQTLLVELAGDKARVAERSDADDSIETILDQVGETVAEAHIESEIGMGIREPRQHRNDHLLSVSDRYIKAQCAARRSPRTFGGTAQAIDFLQHALTALEQFAAVAGEHDLARRAMKQAH